MTRVRVPPLAAVTLWLLGASGAPAPADSLLLVNGNRFEGVVTELTDDRVGIRLSFGEIVLPRAAVREVEFGPSPLEEYFRRAEGLAADDAADAGAWLELARWARGRGLEHSSLEAAKVAAGLEPSLPELAPWMRSAGYLFDRELERWLPVDESMRRRGLVLSGGRWVTPQELAAHERAREEELRRDREAARQERLARAMELLALTQVERARREAEASTRPPAHAVAFFPGFVTGGFFVAPAAGQGHPPPAPSPTRPPGPSVSEQLLRRQPGSIIPIRNPEVRVVRIDGPG